MHEAGDSVLGDMDAGRKKWLASLLDKYRDTMAKATEKAAKAKVTARPKALSMG